ncbi:hypothetical protein G9F71_004805 [Clostridium sp. FP2]|uniref:hypothetical protein n=1 Tax=Clostridium sp. FP2 TaxID=2724481 RepID=UPI001A9A818D|nr:hypothetical protein [Clostridium sp. FP2]MBZ9622178.1 hypothetical protein [Clostridium sp. FP2]
MELGAIVTPGGKAGLRRQMWEYLIGKKRKIKRKKEKGVLTLYSITLDSQNIYEIAKEEFLEQTKSIKKIDGGIEFIFKDDTYLDLHLQDNEDYIITQTNGIANFFSQAPLVNKEVLEQAILQIQLQVQIY